LLDPGTRLGPYTIVELVAVGGMGEVYRAEDTRLHRDVAIKVLPPHLADDKASLDRFRREARAVASLSHPNILSIFDYGDEHGVQYAVSEMLEGETLRRQLSRGPFSPREALGLMLEIADGVAAAHARGIVHRDLKPENIFITTEGRVKVLDFGIARGGTGAFAPRGDHVPTEILPTEPGVVLGTVGYLAPEQVDGRTPTAATDVFSLGCILFEMVAGRLPFSGTSSAHAMVAVLHDSAPRLAPTGDPLLLDVDALVQRCLEKDPRDRPQNAGEMAALIRAVLSGEKTLRVKRPVIEAAITPRWIAIAVVLLVIAAAAFFFVRARNRQLDNGYDLRASDVRGDGETRRLLQLALRSDAAGDRANAVQLLEEACRRPAKTALPAAFLSSFSDAQGNFERSRSWERAAMNRIGGASTYESLLVRYLVTPSSDGPGELSLAKSVLALRPKAWRLRLAAAHILLGQRDREAAARELRQIDVRHPDDRRLMLVLADRASLGDANGAERDLRASRLTQLPAFFHYTQARIAWSRGEIANAVRLFDRAASEAANESLASTEVESLLLSGVALLKLRQWDEAQRRFAMISTRARQFGLTHRVFESAALAAYAAHHAGDLEERERRLAAAAAVDPPVEPAAALRLLAIRLGSDQWRRWSTAAIERDPLLVPVMSLIRAREAWAAGNRGAATRELRRARVEGIDTSTVSEEAELLAAELGLPSRALPADPPYPNILRYLAIFDRESRSAATPVAALVPGR
jgi:hypothetical protein